MLQIKFLRRRTPALHIVIFLLISAIILLLARNFYFSRTSAVKKQKSEELTAISKLKIEQISTWRREKYGDAQMLMKSPFFIEAVEELYKGTEKNSSPILTLLKDFKKREDFSAVTILSPSLDYIIGDSYYTLPSKVLVSDIFWERKIVFSDLYINSRGEVSIDLYVPLILEKENAGKKVGLIILQSDPYTELYNIIQSWPTQSPTSEILLIRRENEHVVYLNKLRHVNNQPIQMRLPFSSKNLPAAMAVKGFKGIYEGTDYRGVPVLAQLGDIPQTGWFVVTKTDLEEVYQPVKELFYSVLFLAISLILTLGIGVALLWRNKKVKYFRKLYEVEKDKQVLSQYFEIFTRYAYDVIFFTDMDGNIKYANNAASLLYGYTIEELKRMNIKDLSVPNKSPDFDYVLDKAKQEEGIIYEASHQTSSGAFIAVEASTKVFKAGGENNLHCIIRDVTGKKKATRQLKRAGLLLRKSNEHLKNSLKERETLLKEVHHRVKNNLQIISSLLHLQGTDIDDDKTKKAFLSSQNRIKSMALIHQQLYSERLDSIDSTDYLGKLIKNLRDSYSSEGNSISIDLKIERKQLSVDIATNLGLLITEIVGNIFKHAFPAGSNGNILVQLTELENRNYGLIVADDGIGLPAGYNNEESPTLGMKLIHAIVQQIKGTMEIITNPGTKYIIEFKDEP